MYKYIFIISGNTLRHLIACWNCRITTNCPGILQDFQLPAGELQLSFSTSFRKPQRFVDVYFKFGCILYIPVQFGRLIRYMMLTSLGLLSICFVRFLFLPGALDGLTHYVTPHPDVMAHGALTMTVVVLQAFGSGWGSVITLSSFNHFKTNVMKYSWVISFGQTLVYILFGMVTFMIKSHFEGTDKIILKSIYIYL